MLPKTEFRYGHEITSTPEGQFNSGENLSWLISVQPGAMIRGDHTTPNPWGYTVEEYHFPKGVVYEDYPGSSPAIWVKRQGYLSGSYTIPLPVFNMDEAYNKAVSRLNDQVRGSLDLSVSLLESSSTVRMIRAIGNWNRWFRGFGYKRWAKEWLGYTYGWKPLLTDIYNACDELQRTADNKLVFDAAGNSQLPDIDKSEWVIHGRPFLMNHEVQSSKCGVRFRVKMKVPRSNADIARWTSLNPLSMLWETLPYSFVVDWFYDVGGYMRDFETAMRYSSAFESGFVTYLSACTVGSRGTYFSAVPGQVVNGTVEARRRYINFSRQILYQYPFPRAPVVNTDLSWKRLVSAAALLSQQLGRSR